jgi:protein SCO1
MGTMDDVAPREGTRPTGPRLPARRNGLVAPWIAALGLLCLAVTPARAGKEPISSLSEETLASLRFQQHLNAQISLDLNFRDETGRTLRLGDYFGRKPVILVLGYYECPMLCTLVNNGLVECLQDLKLDLGKEFDVVHVSIDPREAPALAAAKKRTFLRLYGRRGAEAGWHFLTGDEAAIRRLAAEVGFQYAYDAALKQYAHPSGIVVLTPGGKVARYFFGLTFPPRELAATLRDAGSEKTGSPVQQLLLICFHYNPLHGKYGTTVLTVLRLLGLLTVGSMLWVIVRASRQGRPLIGPPVFSRGGQG